MKAALLEREKTFKMVEVQDPEPGQGEVAIQVMSAGICGSEIEAFFGRHPFRTPPVITGHEMSGVIEKIGKGVEGFGTGERVTIEPQVSCGTCGYCRSGRYNLCLSRASLGTPKWPGPYGEYIKAPASTLIRVPDELNFDVAVLLEPLAVGVHAVRNTRVREGESLIIFGAGTIGLCAMAAAKAIGAGKILMVDISETKLDMGKRMGADFVLNMTGDRPLEKIKEMFPEGANAAVVATGAADAYGLSTKVLRRDGRIGAVGLCRQPILVPIEIGGPGPELEVVGCTAYVRSDFQEAMRILTCGNFETMISKVYPIDGIQEAFDTFIRDNDKLFKVILRHRKHPGN